MGLPYDFSVSSGRSLAAGEWPLVGRDGEPTRIATALDDLGRARNPRILIFNGRLQMTLRMRSSKSSGSPR